MRSTVQAWRHFARISTRSLIQVAVIADVEIPGIADHMRCDPAWALEAYTRPALPE